MAFFPLLLVIMCFFLGVALHWLWPISNIIPEPYNFLGALLFAPGLYFSRMGAGEFVKTATSIELRNDPEQLLTGSVFRYSRNPIYFGFLINLIACAIIAGTVSPYIACLVCFLIFNFVYIPIEEKTLLRLFGNDYLEYKSNVRKWI